MSANFESISLSYSGRQRHPPHPLAGRFAGRDKTVGQFVIVREQSRIFLSERHHDGSRQSRQIDQQFRLVFGIYIMQHVGKDETPLGVGVDDLDGLTGHRLENIARPICIAARHILHQPDGADHIDLGVPHRQRMHQPDHAGRARHVALHVLHTGGLLDRDATRIETHTFTHKGHRRSAAFTAVPAHDDGAALMRGTLTDGEQRPHAEPRHRRRVERFDHHAEFAQSGGAAANPPDKARSRVR